MKIAPSILSANFATLGEEIKNVEAAGADMLHIDVMDGHFVPNLTFGPPVITHIKPITNLPLDVHLMIANPEKHLEAYATAGADILTVHAETLGDHPTRTLEAIKALGCKVGISIKPSTTADAIGPLFDHLDQILVMTVEPGFGGQNFMPEQLKKIEALATWIEKSGKHIDLEVDGGINKNTIASCYAAGANTFVAGSAIFNESDYAAAINSLRSAAVS